MAAITARSGCLSLSRSYRNPSSLPVLALSVTSLAPFGARFLPVSSHAPTMRPRYVTDEVVDLDCSFTGGTAAPISETTCPFDEFIATNKSVMAVCPDHG